jgi:hypothetical protein
MSQRRIKKHRKVIRMSNHNLTCGRNAGEPFDGRCRQCGTWTEAIGMPDGSPYAGRKFAYCTACQLGHFFYTPGEAPVTPKEEEEIFAFLGFPIGMGGVERVAVPDTSRVVSANDACPNCGDRKMEILTIRPGLRGAGRHMIRCASCSWADFVLKPGDPPLPDSEAAAIVAEAGGVPATSTAASSKWVN